MKKLKSHEVEQKLLSLGKKLFTARDLMVIFGAKKRAAEAFIEHNIDRKIFVRVKKGLFALVKNLPVDFYLANNLYRPSYVSLETACSYYGLIPETIYSITSITSKPTRVFKVSSKAFVYQKIKISAYVGFIPRKVNGETVNIATPEKAFADFLYFVFLGKKQSPERLNSAKINRQKFSTYLEFFENERFTLFGKKFLGSK